MTQAAKEVAVIFADGEVDSVQDWASDSVQHVKDLRAMGCKVKVMLFPTWVEAQAYADMKQG